MRFMPSSESPRLPRSYLLEIEQKNPHSFVWECVAYHGTALAVMIVVAALLHWGENTSFADDPSSVGHRPHRQHN